MREHGKIIDKKIFELEQELKILKDEKRKLELEEKLGIIKLFIFPNYSTSEYQIFKTILISKGQDESVCLNSSEFEQSILDFLKKLCNSSLAWSPLFISIPNSSMNLVPFSRFVYESFGNNLRLDFLNVSDNIFLLKRTPEDLLENQILEIDYKFFLRRDFEEWDKKIKEISKYLKVAVNETQKKNSFLRKENKLK